MTLESWNNEPSVRREEAGTFREFVSLAGELWPAVSFFRSIMLAFTTRAAVHSHARILRQTDTLV